MTRAFDLVLKLQWYLHPFLSVPGLPHSFAALTCNMLFHTLGFCSRCPSGIPFMLSLTTLYNFQDAALSLQHLRASLVQLIVVSFVPLLCFIHFGCRSGEWYFSVLIFSCIIISLLLLEYRTKCFIYISSFPWVCGGR